MLVSAFVMRHTFSVEDQSIGSPLGLTHWDTVRSHQVCCCGVGDRFPLDNVSLAREE
jgi:hypothetical protein